ncbi:MAG: hypothetical protein CSA22_01510 [Deltaproteobacteria bacterium]|nr:MAG: hypothetical protein CSA22_01510 [Deltaproteobacteria bacterium]
MNDAFAYYEKEGMRLGFLGCEDPAPSPFLRETRFEVNPEKGMGWGKMLQINSGLYVGLSNFQLKGRPETFHYRLMAPTQFNILLSGHFDLQLPGASRQTLGPGAVWFGHSHQEEMVYSQFHDDTIRGVSIGLPAQFVETWLGNSGDETTRGLERLIFGKSGASTAKRHNFSPLAEGMLSSASLMQTARKLIQAEHQTLFGKLHFESLALELLAQLLTLETGQKTAPADGSCKHKQAVEMAVDILRQEWACPPTTSSLARRVGTNACYLKKGFRSQTGRSIGQYIRELRMGRALELLATDRYSILEIAHAVGYSNPSQFSAAFKRFYGKTPSFYLAEVP